MLCCLNLRPLGPWRFSLSRWLQPYRRTLLLSLDDEGGKVTFLVILILHICLVRKETVEVVDAKNNVKNNLIFRNCFSSTNSTIDKSWRNKREHLC